MEKFDLLNHQINHSLVCCKKYACVLTNKIIILTLRHFNNMKRCNNKKINHLILKPTLIPFGNQKFSFISRPLLRPTSKYIHGRPGGSICPINHFKPNFYKVWYIAILNSFFKDFVVE